MKTKEADDTVLIGRVGSPSGLKGEVRINLYAEGSDNLKEGKVLLLKHGKIKAGSAAGAENKGSAGAGDIRAAISSIRYQKDKPLIKLEGFADRTAVEPLRGMDVYIEADDLEPLPEGEHYVRNLIGCRVVDIAGREIGVLRDVIQNTAQSILEVETVDGRTVLIPAVDAFLRSIDEEARLIEVELIPGFLE